MCINHMMLYTKGHLRVCFCQTWTRIHIADWFDTPPAPLHPTPDGGRRMREKYARYRMLMQSRNRSAINKFHYNGIYKWFSLIPWTGSGLPAVPGDKLSTGRIGRLCQSPRIFMTVYSNAHWRNAKKYLIHSFIGEPTSMERAIDWRNVEWMDPYVWYSEGILFLRRIFLISDFTTVLSRMAVWWNYYEAIVLTLRPHRTGTLKKDLSTEFLSSPSLPKWCIQARLQYPWTNQKER